MYDLFSIKINFFTKNKNNKLDKYLFYYSQINMNLVVVIWVMSITYFHFNIVDFIVSLWYIAIVLKTKIFVSFDLNMILKFNLAYCDIVNFKTKIPINHQV